MRNGKGKKRTRGSTRKVAGAGNGTSGTTLPFHIADHVVVVLVGPKYPGNVGAVARSMMNFGLKDLVLVDPCEITEEALARSMHAAPILRAAKTFPTLKQALATLDYSVATTCEPSRKDKKHLRKALSPWAFARLVPFLGGRVGILLGREDFGLFNTEIEECDIVVTIPTTTEYKSMNLSHAAAIVFYELSKAAGTGRKVRPMKEATGLEKDVLFKKFEEYLQDIDYPMHKRKNTAVLFKRIIGRSALSGWEFHTLTGVFTMASKRIERGVPKERKRKGR